MKISKNTSGFSETRRRILSNFTCQK